LKNLTLSGKNHTTTVIKKGLHYPKHFISKFATQKVALQSFRLKVLMQIHFITWNQGVAKNHKSKLLSSTIFVAKFSVHFFSFFFNFKLAQFYAVTFDERKCWPNN
jgi:hypothetical protein